MEKTIVRELADMFIPTLLFCTVSLNILFSENATCKAIQRHLLKIGNHEYIFADNNRNDDDTGRVSAH